MRERLTEVLERENAPFISAFQLACAELIVNLSRYPDPPPTKVELLLSRDEQHWWLELKDNGPSFNNFSQLINDPDPLAAAESGMGLKLLAQMFADIRYIPACFREDAQNVMVLRQPLSDQQPTRKTLLVVDDDPSYRAIVTAYLSDRYQVVEAQSVSEAFAQVLTYQPELVICDVQMPDEDGPVLFDKLSHIPDAAHTAFIYLSGSQDSETLSRALSRPIDDFLAKPVTREQLVQTIERVLQRRNYLNQQIRRELEERVTLGLQPSLPEQIPGYRVALRSFNPEPGGGDLVQLQQVGEQSMILMADLMGHGLSAKGYSYALAGYLRGLGAAAFNEQLDLEALFGLLSQSFQSDAVLQETLATLIAVQLDASGQLQWVNAGQPFPLHISQAGVVPIEVEGALPGLGVGNYTSLTMQLKRGERLLIYSDGFLDAGLPVTEALRQAVLASSALPLAAAADQLLALGLSGPASADDTTLILIEKT